MVLAARGDYRRFRQAVALLDERPSSQPETNEDRHARAMVLATRPSRHSEAIALLEQLAARQALAPSDQFLLAQLHGTRGDWRSADQWMERLLESNEGSGQYLAHHARVLLRRGKVDAARLWADRLEQLQPETWEAVEIKARVLQARGKGSEAVAHLQKFLTSRRGEAAAALVGPAAGLLKELGQFAAAEKMYRTAVSSPGQSEHLLSFIAFLARRQRTKEALDLCARAWKECSVEAAAPLSVALLSHGKANPEYVRRVEGWLNGALRQGRGPRRHCCCRWRLSATSRADTTRSNGFTAAFSPRPPRTSRR